MKKIKQLFSDSLHEFTVTKNLVLCGLMAALAIVLSIVASISIGPYVKIGFSGIPNRIVEFLFGPVVGCIFGGALDLLKFMIKPDGPFFFGFTFNVMLAGLIYGCPVISQAAFDQAYRNCGISGKTDRKLRFKYALDLHALRKSIFRTASDAPVKECDHAADRQCHRIFRTVPHKADRWKTRFFPDLSEETFRGGILIPDR